MNLDPAPQDQLVPDEGWHVLHLFYHVDHANWSVLSDHERLEAKTQLTELAQEVRTHPNTQLILFSVVSPKADIGCLLLTPDLQDLNAFEKQLTQSLGPDILTPVYSHLSITERNVYFPTAEESGGAADEAAMRARQIDQDRLYPTMPDWPIIGFYAFSMRRGPEPNWFTTSEASRRQLMLSQAETLREFVGKVRHIVTGSIGLDDLDWGVTLFAQSSTELKRLVTKNRFDKVNAIYAELGEIYIGIQLPLDELFRRVGI